MSEARKRETYARSKSFSSESAVKYLHVGRRKIQISPPLGEQDQSNALPQGQQRQSNPHPMPCLPPRRLYFDRCINASVGPGICQPRGQPRAFDTYAVSYQNITTQKILPEKQADWIICQGREKIEEVCKGMFSVLLARIPSLLIKPELHSETRELST